MSLIVWKNCKILSKVFTVAHFKSNWRHPFTHYVTFMSVLIIFGTQTSSLNTWISEVKSWFFRFFSKKKKKIMSITKKIPLDASLYMRLLHYEHKFSICITRRSYPERKNCPNSSFSNNFYHLNLNIRETFLFCFQT